VVVDGRGERVSAKKAVDGGGVVDEVIGAFSERRFIDTNAVVRPRHRRIEREYPTPWLGATACLTGSMKNCERLASSAVNHILQGARERTCFDRQSGRDPQGNSLSGCRGIIACWRQPRQAQWE
jgi:hypothetical protein